MKPIVRTIGVLTLSAVLACSIAIARAAADDAAMNKSTVKSDMLFWIEDAENKLGQLAEAMPEDKYAWRPGDGVRSAGEVFMHVAAANYGIPAFWGVTPPEGFDFGTYEESLTGKSDIQKALKDSFTYMKGALSRATDADFEKPVKLFGMEMSMRRAYMLIVTHCHEHLGQSIAYARVNGVVPPWSRKPPAAYDKKTEAREEKKSGD